MNAYAKLNEAKSKALKGSFEDLVELTNDCLLNSEDVSLLLDLGGALLGIGFVSDAARCFSLCKTLDPKCYAALVNRANAFHSVGEHGIARDTYEQLLCQLTEEPVIRRNALTMSEYDAAVSNVERLAAARSWGSWVVGRAGGLRDRIAMNQLQNRPLRVGYVSADICQHTVGLFLKEVLLSHDLQRVDVFLYSSGQHRDWVTAAVKPVVTFREVSALNDVDLACQIKDDQIDVLVDLSGHTAGSRLSAFAYRPAPVMVSWLGYFATTGLPYMDAVLLDEWHAPPGIEAQFVEPILRLPLGRFCYQPVPWAPQVVSDLPYFKNGFITFGCFNNTAKLNDQVLATWAEVLRQLSGARLVLKWRTFNDKAYKEQVWLKFLRLGVEKERIELRGPSFHKDLLYEYADIDIALDPYPFCGGLTTCESLWMGVPVVTLPQDRVVSRQSHAILNVIGLGELSAKDENDYVRIAVELAKDPCRLGGLRSGMRKKMQASSLMRVEEFTRSIEDHLIGLFQSKLNENHNRTV